MDGDRPLFAAAIVGRRRYFMVAPRPFSAVPLVVRRRCLIVVLRPISAAPRMHTDGIVQAVARGAARCELHVHGRGARTAVVVDIIRN